LKTEYQKVKRELCISGAGTDDHPQLHRSALVFDQYEEFYSLYYPHSTVPAM